jgi:hypothetical protein
MSLSDDQLQNVQAPVIGGHGKTDSHNSKGKAKTRPVLTAEDYLGPADILTCQHFQGATLGQRGMIIRFAQMRQKNRFQTLPEQILEKLGGGMVG